MGCALGQVSELPSRLGGVTLTWTVLVLSGRVGLFPGRLFCCGLLQWFE